MAEREQAMAAELATDEEDMAHCHMSSTLALILGVNGTLLNEVPISSRDHDLVQLIHVPSEHATRCKRPLEDDQEGSAF